MTVSAGKKTFESLKRKNHRSDILLKLVQYVYHLNNLSFTEN